MKKIKVTICPPAPQDVFFQRNQFDEELTGTNPIAYLDRKQAIRNTQPSSLERASDAKREKLDDAAKSLEGHPNRKQIMRILRSGL